MELLRLTRPLNLLIIVLTMCAVRYGIIAGSFELTLHQVIAASGVENVTTGQLTFDGPRPGPVFPWWLFALLALSTVMIAAGGNVINDYFDTRIDRVNKPEDVIVGRSVKRRTAMAAHLSLSGAGLLIGAFVAWRGGQLHLAVIPLFAIVALWSYSTTFKRRFIIGNGLVSLLTALVPITVGLYEFPAIAGAFGTGVNVGFPDGTSIPIEFTVGDFWYWIGAYALFAFLGTLVRELQKDMADVKGDEADGCRTVPIVLGMTWAKGLTLLYIAALIAGVMAVRMFFLRDGLSFWYLGFAVVAPLLVSGGFTFAAQDRRGHLIAANLTKVAMVTAVAYAWLIRFT